MVSTGLIIFGGIVIFVVIFVIVPFGSTESQPSLGVPAPGFEDVPEMIVQEEPVTMFCRIYPNSGSCRR